MNKFYLLTFFCFIFLFSTTALACDFCYVKNLTCPSIAQANQSFYITFRFSGTGPEYPYQYLSLFISGLEIGCTSLDKEACQWYNQNFKVTAPPTPGIYKYTVKCYAAEFESEEYCSLIIPLTRMEDDSVSCTVNVVGDNIQNSSSFIKKYMQYCSDLNCSDTIDTGPPSPIQLLNPISAMYAQYYYPNTNVAKYLSNNNVSNQNLSFFIRPFCDEFYCPEGGM